MTDPIFGTSVADAVAQTVTLAIQEGRPESFTRAAHQIEGIRRLFIYSTRGGYGSHTVIALGNEIARLHQMAEDTLTRSV